MPMKTALSVRLRGEMPQAKLDGLRARLGLQRRGRLTDLEDADFGYLYLSQVEGHLVRLTLYRNEDTEWMVNLSYQDEPPAEDTVEEFRSRIFEAARAMGFAAEESDR